MGEIITSAEAIERLRRVGYHVEHDSAHGIVYARASGNGTGLPARLYESAHKGFVSALAVKRLETRMAARTPDALERLLRLAENLTPSGVIGDGMVAEFHSLAAQVRKGGR